MSAFYNLEPQPTGKVLLQTTAGEILLELFAKQTPLASRNFLQLCLDGYYNGTIFHRLVPGFVLQGGDPTGTGEGGEAIYDGGVFADEFHTRLKFNRRGLLGMANTGQKDDNGSQFFLTLGKAEELNGKNTMFGRVVGDTIYNLMKMAEAELASGDGNERPLYPTMITGTEILVNPFEDMIARHSTSSARIVDIKQQDKKKAKKKAGKILLSFGDEGQDLDQAPALKKAKYNKKLVVASAAPNVLNVETEMEKLPVTPSKQERGTVISPVSKQNQHPETQLPLRNDEQPSRDPSSSPEPTQLGRVSSLLERTKAEIAEVKASMRRNIAPALSEPLRKKSALEQMIPETSMRGRKRKHGANGNTSGDAQALKLLAAFRKKLDDAAPEPELSASPNPENEEPTFTHIDTEEPPEDDEEAHLCDLHFIANCQSCKSWDQQGNENTEAENEDDKGWMSHALSFEKDRLGKDLTWKRKNEEELVVIDPREKAKDIKEEQRAKKSAKGGATGRAWDRDRDRGRIPEKKAGERS